MDFKRSHVSARPPGPPRTIKQNPTGLHTNFKPLGLWYQIGNAWEQWYQDENFGICLGSYYITEVVFIGGAILRLTCREDILRFIADYPAKNALLNIPGEIEWEAVAADFSGIEIFPYDRSLVQEIPFGALWHYSWDCSSGCVWDGNAFAFGETRMIFPAREI